MVAVSGGGAEPEDPRRAGQIQILSNLIDYGMSVQQAIDLPRMFARGDVFDVEGTVPCDIVDGLRALGHQPTRAPNPLGTAQAIWIDAEAWASTRRSGSPSRRHCYRLLSKTHVEDT